MYVCVSRLQARNLAEEKLVSYLSMKDETDNYLLIFIIHIHYCVSSNIGSLSIYNVCVIM